MPAIKAAVLNSTLKARQHRILKALEKPGTALSRRLIMDECFNGNSTNLAPDLKALLAAKAVVAKTVDVAGKEEEVFTLTATGRKILKAGCQDSRLPKPGSVLTRMYKDKEHKVTVLADGFQWGKKTFPSLTATAKAIIGKDTEVNGFAWFGLTNNDK